MSSKSLFFKFSTLTDKKTTHILAEIMFISVCAILCGADDWNSIRWFAVRMSWKTDGVKNTLW
ncbi:MAG: transposase family protein [Endozoicomonadaceae bacterium]|nr:transposase family protein [Endozoicomonadaceae bacterium]